MFFQRLFLDANMEAIINFKKREQYRGNRGDRGRRGYVTWETGRRDGTQRKTQGTQG